MGYINHKTNFGFNEVTVGYNDIIIYTGKIRFVNLDIELKHCFNNMKNIGLRIHTFKDTTTVSYETLDNEHNTSLINKIMRVSRQHAINKVNDKYKQY